ncbi:MAG: HupE/UreJ family protein [Vicinamibacterales bacterium]
MRTRLTASLVVTLSLLVGHAGTAEAHPAPFSFLDLHLDATGLHGSIVLHDLDVAHDLQIEPPDALLEPAVAERERPRIAALLDARLRLAGGGTPRTLTWTDITIERERFGLRLSFTAGPRPDAVDVHAVVFPYDPIHQTFVNVYEDGALRQQNILTADQPSMRFYAGTAQGRLAVVRTFVASGIEHILIGPDHILFLVGLLLLGGTLPRLAAIVTAFTVGHSVTLTLAALDIVSPPARIVEPLIALTIVIVGTDNLFVLYERSRHGTRERPARDARPLFAGFFGLVHGFGFASVLRSFGLPQGALAWSLVSFNVGVELGQLLIVVLAAGALAVVARASARSAAQVAWWGSIGVILAGGYWFVTRLFGTGG